MSESGKLTKNINFNKISCRLWQQTAYFAGGVYHETCFCPELDGNRWREAMNCPKKYSQIEKDLLPFDQINLEDLAKEAVGRFGTHHAICHYSVINNQVGNTV